MAGLEALRDAGIVTGEGQDGWMLPGHMRDTTGVMYASSFPALDAAIGEVRVLRKKKKKTTVLCYGKRTLVLLILLKK